MLARSLLFGTLSAGGLLFVLSGLAQRLPWGVPSATVLLSRGGGPPPFQAPGATVLPPHALTTPAFDEAVTGRIVTLTTDATFSWIVAQPIARYRPAAYLTRELVTQLTIGALLTLLLVLLGPRALAQQLGVVTLLALLTTLATYGQLMNWWGLPPRYAIGVSINLIVSWALAAVLITRVVPAVRGP